MGAWIADWGWQLDNHTSHLQSAHFAHPEADSVDDRMVFELIIREDLTAGFRGNLGRILGVIGVH